MNVKHLQFDINNTRDLMIFINCETYLQEFTAKRLFSPTEIFHEVGFLFMRNFPRSGYSYSREIFREAVILTHRNFPRSGFLIHEEFSAKRLFLFTRNFPRSGYSHPQEFTTKWVSYSRGIFIK